MKINPEELFQEENAVNRGSFFKFLEVGDRLYGTLTGIRRGQDGFGNEQTIYEVLTDEGEYKLFGNKKPIIASFNGFIVVSPASIETPSSSGRGVARIIPANIYNK